jgi:hypothetical protein
VFIKPLLGEWSGRCNMHSDYPPNARGRNNRKRQKQYEHVTSDNASTCSHVDDVKTLTLVHRRSLIRQAASIMHNASFHQQEVYWWYSRANAPHRNHYTMSSLTLHYYTKLPYSKHALIYPEGN